MAQKGRPVSGPHMAVGAVADSGAESFGWGQHEVWNDEAGFAFVYSLEA